jgi:hypothetical protein
LTASGWRCGNAAAAFSSSTGQILLARRRRRGAIGIALYLRYRVIEVSAVGLSYAMAA